MRKISGEVESSKPLSLSRASKIISTFAKKDIGSSSAISIYIKRTAEAFNHLNQFHKKNRRFKQTSTTIDEETVEESNNKKKKHINQVEEKRKKRRMNSDPPRHEIIEAHPLQSDNHSARFVEEDTKRKY